MPRSESIARSTGWVGVSLLAILMGVSLPWVHAAPGQENPTVQFLPLPDASGNADTTPQPDVAIQAPEGVEPLARGPVHEAFAEPVGGDPQPGPVIPAAPPDPVNEVPPEVRPEGENVVWVPGYWAWDEEAEKHLWVSGIWRDVPPGRRWVPGYWTEADGGARWVSGFWAAADVEQVEYLDPPPASLEAGPPVEATSNDQFWVPGTWVYQDTSYAWRPGYWQDYRENWMWVPAHYTWTPAGCVYVPGYWDYRLPYRGQLFAPAYISPLAYTRPGFFYRPYYVINTASLLLHLFVAPRHHHYYFGNYYGPWFASRYYYPFAHYHRFGYGFDPLYSYYRVHFRRRGIDYGRRLNSWHNYFTHYQQFRPPVHLHDHLQFARQHRNHAYADQLILAKSLDEVRRHPNPGHRFVSAETSRDTYRRNIDELRRMARVRSSEERNLARAGDVRTGDRPRDDVSPRRGRGPSRWDLSRDFASRDAGPNRRQGSDDSVSPRRNGRDNNVARDAADSDNRGRRGNRGPQFSGQTINRPNARDVTDRPSSQNVTGRDLAGDRARGNRETNGPPRIPGPSRNNAIDRRNGSTRPDSIARPNNFARPDNVTRSNGVDVRRGPQRTQETFRLPSNTRSIPDGPSFAAPERRPSRRDFSAPSTRSTPRAAPQTIAPVTGVEPRSPRINPQSSVPSPSRSQPRAAGPSRVPFNSPSVSPRSSSRMEMPSGPSRASRGPSFSGSGHSSGAARMSAPSPRPSRGPSMSGSGRSSAPARMSAPSRPSRMSAPSRPSRGPASGGGGSRGGGGGGGGGRGNARGRR